MANLALQYTLNKEYNAAIRTSLNYVLEEVKIDYILDNNHFRFRNKITFLSHPLAINKVQKECTCILIAPD